MKKPKKQKKTKNLKKKKKLKNKKNDENLMLPGEVWRCFNCKKFKIAANNTS